MQEQQWQQTKVWNPNSMSLEQKLSDFKQWKQNTDTHYAAQKEIDMDNDTKKLYEWWLKVNDRETKKKYDVASRGNLLAQMVTKVAETNWVALTWNATDRVSAYLQGFPDDYQAFYDFTHWDQDPEEFGVQMWWIKQKKEKSVYDLLTGDEWDSSLVGRSVNWLLWTVIGSWEWVLNAMKRVYNNMWDIKEIANDERPFIDKFNEILFWEIIWDSIWGSIWDIVWGMMEWGFKGITKQSERDKLSNKLWEFVQKAMDSDTWQDAVEYWNWLSEEDKAYVKKYLGYWEWFLNLLWLKWGKAAAKPVEQWFKKLGWLVDDVAWSVGSKMTWAKNAVTDTVKWAEKAIVWNNKTPEKIAWTILQWKDKSDQIVGRKVLTEDLDTKWVETFEQLKNKTWESKKKVMKELNKELDKEEWLLTREDLMTVSNKETVLWDKPATEDFFNDALDALIKRYENRPSKRVVYDAYKEKLNWEWLTKREAYDVTREFWREFSNWMYKRDWTLKDTIWAKDAEDIRMWMKEKIREKLSWDYAKLLDEKYSRLSRVEELAEDMQDAVLRAEQKLADKNIIGRIWDLYKKTIKKIKWENPDNMSLTQMEENLKSNLEKLNKVYDEQFKKERLDFSKQWEWLMKFRSKNADYMIASAENPMGKAWTAESNAASHQAFKDFLDKNNIQYREQKGKYWNEENSLIIAIDNPKQRTIIDSFLEKTSPQEENIIVKNWVAYRYDPRTKEAYKVDLRKNNIDVAWDANDYYSEIDWRKYKLPLYESWIEVQITPEEFLSVYNS